MKTMATRLTKNSVELRVGAAIEEFPDLSEAYPAPRPLARVLRAVDALREELVAAGATFDIYYDWLVPARVAARSGR